jgi:hypothetical protein
VNKAGNFLVSKESGRASQHLAVSGQTLEVRLPALMRGITPENALMFADPLGSVVGNGDPTVMLTPLALRLQKLLTFLS